MPTIRIIGTGTGDLDLLTVKAVNSLKNGNKTFVNTEKDNIIEFLEQNSIIYSTYDSIYNNNSSYKRICDNITSDLVKKCRQYGIINYCVPGNPRIDDEITHILLQKSKKEGFEVELIEGLSITYSNLLKVNKGNNEINILTSNNINSFSLDVNKNNLITIRDDYNLLHIKEKLERIYGSGYIIYIIMSKKSDTQNKKIPINELERYDNILNIYIPKTKKYNRKTYNMYNLMNIMEKLRSKGGCPWDREQTHRSLREFVVEEAYEVVDAIDKEDVELLIEELGDILLQVVFHSQIAAENNNFYLYDVITRVCKKMIYRHPHVFNNIDAKDAKCAKQSWDSMKDKEKNISTYTERLIDIPKGLCALGRSYKVQKKAADVGFDWDKVEDAFLKVVEEYEELKQASRGDNLENIEEELGDLLFSVVNVSRFLNVNPEIALNNTINKFIKRFSIMEEQSSRRGKDLKEMSLKEMDDMWNMAKIHKK